MNFNVTGRINQIDPRTRQTDIRELNRSAESGTSCDFIKSNTAFASAQSSVRRPSSQTSPKIRKP